MSPYTAKQLSVALNNVVQKYESTYGSIDEKTVSP